MFKNILARLNTMSTQLIGLCIALSLGFMLGGVLIARAGGVAYLIGGFFVPLGFLFWGLTGVPMIIWGMSLVIRRELPWLITIRGWLAVVGGIVLVVMGILISVLLWTIMLGGS